jgi:hypothetical protein
MARPTQIYSSTLSRRERAWGRSRRSSLPALAARAAGASALACTIALIVAPYLSG